MRKINSTTNRRKPLDGHFLKGLARGGSNLFQSAAEMSRPPRSSYLPIWIDALSTRITPGDYAYVDQACDAVYPVRVVAAQLDKRIVRLEPQSGLIELESPEGQKPLSPFVGCDIRDALKEAPDAVKKAIALPLGGCLPSEYGEKLFNEGTFLHCLAKLSLSAESALDSAAGCKMPGFARQFKKDSSKRLEKSHDRFVFPSGRAVDYEIEYQARRRRSALFVIRGRLVMRHPVNKSSRTDEQQFLLRNEAWIFRMLEKQKAASETQNFVIKNGGCVLFRGERARLLFSGSREAVVRLSSESDFAWEIQLPIPFDANEQIAREALCRLLKREAQPVIAASFSRMSVLAKRQPPVAWCLSNAWRQWGNCSSRGQIRLAWRLVCLPDALIDYVVAHELAHLVEFNHSARFWAEVERMLPDCQARRAACRKIGLILPR